MAIARKVQACWVTGKWCSELELSYKRRAATSNHAFTVVYIQREVARKNACYKTGISPRRARLCGSSEDSTAPVLEPSTKSGGSITYTCV